jgi:hypothetical protein
MYSYRVDWNVSITYSEDDLGENLSTSSYTRSGTLREKNRIDWQAVIYRFRVWLDNIRDCVDYMNEPDLWRELAAFKEILDETDFENTPFTSTDQTAITARIEQVKEYIRTSGELTSEQISRVEARLDHAEEASKRIGRKDWLMMVTGSILSLVLGDTITPQAAGHILTLLGHGLGHLFGYGGPPPQLP